MLVLSSIVLGAAGLAAAYAARTTSWAVMTDELQVARLAVSIAETFSPVPTIHGVYYGAHSQLYPLLLAPFYGSLSAPAAATAAHALNGLLLASAAVPAYLLARSVTGSRAAGYVAAALTAFTPWLAISATLLTENAAYPAFAWAVLLCHRALAEPSPRRDWFALAGLLLAFLARTQLVVLALALPLALVLHELGLSLRAGKTTREALRASAASHRVLVGAYLAGALAAGVLALGGSLGGIVGNYAVPFEGDLVPDGLWSSAAAHFDQIAVGVGILPVLLAGSWVLTTAVRPDGREAHAFAALTAVLVPALTLQVTSFDLRFTPEQFIQERYLVYVVPLVAVGAAAWLARTDGPRTPARDPRCRHRRSRRAARVRVVRPRDAHLLDVPGGGVLPGGGDGRGRRRPLRRRAPADRGGSARSPRRRVCVAGPTARTRVHRGRRERIRSAPGRLRARPLRRADDVGAGGCRRAQLDRRGGAREPVRRARPRRARRTDRVVGGGALEQGRRPRAQDRLRPDVQPVPRGRRLDRPRAGRARRIASERLRGRLGQARRASGSAHDRLQQRDVSRCCA